MLRTAVVAAVAGSAAAFAPAGPVSTKSIPCTTILAFMEQKRGRYHGVKKVTQVAPQLCLIIDTNRASGLRLL